MEQCGFYGSWPIAIDANQTRKAQCPACGAVRTLQKRADSWHFPLHPMIDGDSTYHGPRWVSGINGEWSLENSHLLTN